MPTPHPHRHGIAGIALPLAFFTLFFLLNAVVGYFSIRNVEEDQLRVTESLDHINRIQRVHIEILRAETGQRGYLLTALDSYAAPYEAALEVLDRRLAELLQARFDERQRENLYELQVLVGEKLNEMRNSVAALRDNQETEAIQLLFSHRGRNIMSEISAVLGRMTDYENAQLAQRLEDARGSRGTSFYVILLANLVGLVMVFVAVSLVRKYLRKEEEFARTLQEANDNLEAKVEERTAALSHYSNELKRSNRELQDFAFVASHDLQEPLRKIRAFGDRLQHNFAEQLGDTGADYVDRMQNASMRMSALISDLLSFSRITTKAEPFVAISLQEVVDEVLEDLEIAIEEAGAEVSVGALPEIEADRFQMKQLFQNLLGNAIKFRHPELAPRIRIQAHVEERDSDTNTRGAQWVRIEVDDNGIGFDEKFAARIFTPFQRLHARTEYEGTGIGLAVCRRIVERHGGSIEAHSTAGSGSRFVIHLPRKNIVFNLEGTIHEE